MAPSCSYGVKCLKMPVQLKECKAKPGCTNLLHHICQTTYEHNNRLENCEMKMICYDCISKNIPARKLELDINEQIYLYQSNSKE